ncbi:pentapeptide repeat-containing protein [Actinokineospora iranica]|uniref:Uncharacterized protein YjbI, contains pentapeptide repeats n=1 Tax=Actinokineospora iranica TaxID=1271860 RepID=A0A1G6ZGU6_9PSEU|nr:pentapeptide repeat-containing protein [Actinokineospora iranica]SDE01691.1 Uncharacterized protein YjbI, contains pentapeptide repeats [Actinokineospora iranica]
MEFLKVAGKTIQRASIAEEDLVDDSPNFQGEFDYAAARLAQGDQSGVAGEGSLSVVLISDVDLSGSRLGPVELSNVRFDGVNFANATVSAVVARRTEVLRSQAIGLRIDIAKAIDVYAEECRFDYATFRFEQVKGAVVFRGCSFRESVLTGDLSNVVFDNCELTGTEFEATRAAGCDLTESRLTGIRGLLTLRGARINDDQASVLAGQIASEAGLTVIP